MITINLSTVLRLLIQENGSDGRVREVEQLYLVKASQKSGLGGVNPLHGTQDLSQVLR